MFGKGKRYHWVWALMIFNLYAVLRHLWRLHHSSNTTTPTSQQEPDISLTKDKQIAHINHPKKNILDDFKKIKGIGPKISDILHNEGINNFKQLASMDASQLIQLLDKYNIHRPNIETWISQANNISIITI